MTLVYVPHGEQGRSQELLWSHSSEDSVWVSHAGGHKAGEYDRLGLHVPSQGSSLCLWFSGNSVLFLLDSSFSFSVYLPICYFFFFFFASVASLSSIFHSPPAASWSFLLQRPKGSTLDREREIRTYTYQERQIILERFIFIIILKSKVILEVYFYYYKHIFTLSKNKQTNLENPRKAKYQEKIKIN